MPVVEAPVPSMTGEVGAGIPTKCEPPSVVRTIDVQTGLAHGASPEQPVLARGNGRERHRVEAAGDRPPGRRGRGGRDRRGRGRAGAVVPPGPAAVDVVAALLAA